MAKNWTIIILKWKRSRSSRALSKKIHIEGALDLDKKGKWAGEGGRIQIAIHPHLPLLFSFDLLLISSSSTEKSFHYPRTHTQSVSEELLLILVSLMLLVGPIMRLIPHYPSRIRRVIRNNVFDTQTESRNKKRKVKSRCNPNFLPSFRPSVQLLSNYMCVNTLG